MLILDAHIAQDFWRLVYPLDRVLKPAPAFIPELSAAQAGHWSEVATNKREAWAQAPSWLDSDFCARCGGRLDTLVFDKSQTRSSRTHRARQLTTTLPEGSFYDLGDGVMVPSPAFTFVRLAPELTVAELIAYGDELCGHYVFDETAQRGMRKREIPLVTKSQLELMVTSAHGMRGRDRALIALPHIVEHSASPMETMDEMLLCLPYRLGGYGIDVPTMNHYIEFSEKAISIAGQSFCYCDLCWVKEFLGCEHQGLFDHSQPKAFAADRARINGLKADGYEIVELTNVQVSDLQAFEEIALYLARRLGKRVRRAGLGATDERLGLRKTLYGWNARFGHAAPDAR